MSKLEMLVPPPELCKQIPEGQFKDSALVWTQGVDGMFIDFRDARPEDEEGNFPAPTLEEIMDELARLELCPGIDLIVNIKGEVCGSINAARRGVSFCGGSVTTALQLYLDAHNRGTVTEVKDDKC